MICIILCTEYVKIVTVHRLKKKLRSIGVLHELHKVCTISGVFMTRSLIQTNKNRLKGGCGKNVYVVTFHNILFALNCKYLILAMISFFFTYYSVWQGKNSMFWILVLTTILVLLKIKVLVPMLLRKSHINMDWAVVVADKN
jgi:hypothetical protein